MAAQQDEAHKEGINMIKTEPSEFDYFTYQPLSCTDYYQMLEDSLKGMKEMATSMEENAINQQAAADRAIKAAAQAKYTAERVRKTAIDSENARQGLDLGGNDMHRKMLDDSLKDMKEMATSMEEIAISKQAEADRAIKAAAQAKYTAERVRKTAEDSEKSSQALRDSLLQKMLENPLSDLKI